MSSSKRVILGAIECGRLAAWPKVKQALSRALKIPESELFPAEGETYAKS